MINKRTPEAKVILDFIERRIKKKLSCNIIFTGELGKGKSYSGIRLLELWYKRWLDEPFPISHVCETLDEAVLIVKDFKRKGEGVLIEELSVLAGSRESLTKLNRLWNKFMDTCRIKQAVIIGNSPFLNFIDKHIISLSQMWIEALGVNFRKKICVCKPLILQPSQKKVYFHRLIDDDGNEINMCFFRMPDKELIKRYDELKDRSVAELYDEIAQRMTYERKRQLKEIGRVTLAWQEEQDYNDRLKGLTVKEIAKKRKVSVSTVAKNIARAKKKMNMMQIKGKMLRNLDK